MDAETFYALCFMVFSLGFFLLVFWLITSDHNRQQDRQDLRAALSHARQYIDKEAFGFDAVERSLEAQHQRTPLLRRIF